MHVPTVALHGRRIATKFHETMRHLSLSQKPALRHVMFVLQSIQVEYSNVKPLYGYRQSITTEIYLGHIR